MSYIKKIKGYKNSDKNCGKTGYDVLTVVYPFIQNAYDDWLVV